MRIKSIDQVWKSPNLLINHDFQNSMSMMIFFKGFEMLGLMLHVRVRKRRYTH